MTNNSSKILKILSEEYPDPESELNFENEFQLLVAVMLSAQCTDKKVNEVTPELFKRYPTFEKLSRARVGTIEGIIRQVNYYKTKSKHLVAMGKLVTADHDGAVPRSFEGLVSLPGVGQKTANVILNELGIAPAFPVDTHVFRVSKRLHFASAETVQKVEEELKERFKPEVWRELHHWLILHGRRVCKAQNPLCQECRLSQLCPEAVL